MLKFFIRVSIDKRVNIKWTGKPTLVISNHASLLDGSIFVGSLSWEEFRSISPLKALLAKWYFYSPLLPFVYIIGCFPARPITRKFRNIAGTKGATKNLSKGYSVGFYPEGERSPDKRIKAHFGIVKVLSNFDDHTIYLCKISKKGKRDFKVIIEQNDRVGKLKDPNAIMDEIYNLK